MNRTIQIAPVRKSVVVEATPDEAFEFFTAKIDRWWPRTHGIGATPLRESVIEPFVGGRWYTRHEGGEEVTVGHVRDWQPGRRFVFGWEIDGNWKPEARLQFSSEVEVNFIAQPDGRTRVDVEHRHFEKMESGAEKMRESVDNGWPGILGLFAQALTNKDHTGAIPS
jgi:uncharacterized protein YndB with AHSA1/START domain